MPKFRIVALCLAAVLPMAAQQNPRNITLAHIHLNSADPDAAIAFWKDVIGAQTYTREGINGVIMPGAMILFNKVAPTGPSAGSAIDHIGVKVPNLIKLGTQLEKTKFKSETNKDGDTVVIDGPDGVKIEVSEDNDMYMSLDFGHIHVQTPKPAETQAWFAAHFNARPGGDEKVTSSRVGNLNVVFSVGGAGVPTKGRAIDHLSFESRDLAGLTKALTGDGLQLETQGPIVYLEDPTGIRIELAQAAAQ